MYEVNMLSMADKDLLSEFLYRSICRVLNVNVRAGGLVYYLNSCMVPVVSKHRAFPY
jgi:hypothetical protein